MSLELSDRQGKTVLSFPLLHFFFVFEQKGMHIEENKPPTDHEIDGCRTGFLFGGLFSFCVFPRVSRGNEKEKEREKGVR